VGAAGEKKDKCKTRGLRLRQFNGATKEERIIIRII